MFVVVADVLEFFDRLAQTVKFIVCYEVKSETMTTRLTLNVGEIKIDFKTITGLESEMRFAASDG